MVSNARSGLPITTMVVVAVAFVAIVAILRMGDYTSIVADAEQNILGQFVGPQPVTDGSRYKPEFVGDTCEDLCDVRCDYVRIAPSPEKKSGTYVCAIDKQGEQEWMQGGGGVYCYGSNPFYLMWRTTRDPQNKKCYDEWAAEPEHFEGDTCTTPCAIRCDAYPTYDGSLVNAPHVCGYTKEGRLIWGTPTTDHGYWETLSLCNDGIIQWPWPPPNGGRVKEDWTMTNPFKMWAKANPLNQQCYDAWEAGTIGPVSSTAGPEIEAPAANEEPATNEEPAADDSKTEEQTAESSSSSWISQIKNAIFRSRAG